ncbi:MAG TPA: hypothetical protein ENG63_08310 [Candidatus Desulfofervidus auxilii]|uniref:DNA-binding protein n=1 Tax=Desulfofervidus auxilii TaxID=1621989 RepID=A0A7C0U3P3_DESA2|nr:hypothetical protein [Candidatus Desulfofervidus auxilii]
MKKEKEILTNEFLDTFLSTADVERMFGITKYTVERWIHLGCVFYDEYKVKRTLHETYIKIKIKAVIRNFFNRKKIRKNEKFKYWREIIEKEWLSKCEKLDKNGQKKGQ